MAAFLTFRLAYAVLSMLDVKKKWQVTISKKRTGITIRMIGIITFKIFPLLYPKTFHVWKLEGTVQGPQVKLVVLSHFLNAVIGFYYLTIMT